MSCSMAEYQFIAWHESVSESKSNIDRTHRYWDEILLQLQPTGKNKANHAEKNAYNSIGLQTS